jgi:microcystin-dependent protein
VVGSEFNRIGQPNTVYGASHESADTDTSDQAIHHTLGSGRFQAAPGNRFAAVAAQVVELIGEVKLWILNTPPEHFLVCDGQALDTTTYAELFAVIGYNFGGSGSSFNLPDARFRFLMGAVGGAIGTSDGQIPALRPALRDHLHNHGGGSGSVGGGTVYTSVNTHGHGINSAATFNGGSHSHVTAQAGAHSHSTGAPTTTVTRDGAATAVAAGGSHNHSISDVGPHQHLVTSDTGHTHGVYGGTDGDSHDHVVTLDDVELNIPNSTTQHPFLGFAVIIRYRSGVDADE